MLELDSLRWAELEHAYGNASNIPDLLEQLEAVAQGRLILPTPKYAFQAQPWASLWGALCHQGSVYTASYAAVPHILRIAAQAKQGLWEYFHIVTSIEIGRLTHGSEIPEDLAAAYRSALRQIHELVYSLRDDEWDELLSGSIAAALVVCKGHTRLGQTIIELDLEDSTPAF